MGLFDWFTNRIKYELEFLLQRDVEDKIEAELANEQLVRDLSEVSSPHYNLTKITSRTRTIYFKNKPEWTHTTTVWNIGFSASGFINLNKSISPLPIEYKQEALEFLSKRQNRGFNQRKTRETKKLIVGSLLKSPKTIDELAKELLMKQTTIRAHLKGHPTYTDSLIKLGIVERVDEKLLRRGGFAKVEIYGIKNIDKASEFVK